VLFNVWVVLVRSPYSVLATKAVIGVVHALMISGSSDEAIILIQAISEVVSLCSAIPFRQNRLLEAFCAVRTPELGFLFRNATRRI